MIEDLIVRFVGAGSRWGITAHVPLVAVSIVVLVVVLADRRMQSRR